MSTTRIVFPSTVRQQEPERYIINPVPLFEGPLLSVFKVKLKYFRQTGPTYIVVMKIGGNIFLNLDPHGIRFKLKSCGREHHAFHPVGNEVGSMPAYIYEVSTVETIINLGKEELVVRKDNPAQ